MRRQRLGLVCLVSALGCAPQDDGGGALTVALAGPGPTAFVHSLALSGASLGQVTSVEFTIAPRPGSVSRPVDVTYGIAALRARDGVSASEIRFPVFGLYSGFDNQLTIRVQLANGSTLNLPIQISTPAHVDLQGIYDRPTILRPRATGSALGFDFFALKSSFEPVTIVDTDGAIRWVGTGMPSPSVTFQDNAFVVGSPSSGTLQRVELDGTVTTTTLLDPTVSDFTHNIDPGKQGVLAELDVTGSTDATLEEVDRTGWILGDPSKYWYSFPSLRAKALRLAPGGLAPIGQHATSITSDGLLMLFNDGYPSIQQPDGAPAGEARSYSAVSAYAIDPVQMTAEEVWRFDDDQSIDSAICSSAYEAADRSVLVDFAFADGGTSARLIGLDASHQVVFDFQYPNANGCGTAWNAIPVALDHLEFR